MRRELQPREDREVFVVPLAVADADIDENGHVNNVVYVRWLQEVGTAHWLARFDTEARGTWSWVASRHEVDYFRALPPGSRPVARTWVGEPQGARFNRYVRIENEAGQLCAQGLSEWVLVDGKTMRPSRIPADLLGPFQA